MPSYVQVAPVTRVEKQSTVAVAESEHAQQLVRVEEEVGAACVQLRYCHSTVPLRPSWVIGRIMTRGRPFFCSISHTATPQRLSRAGKTPPWQS